MKNKFLIILSFILSASTLLGQLRLSATISGTDNDTIKQAEPLMLKIQIYDAGHTTALAHNMMLEKNLERLEKQLDEEQISKEEYEKEKEKLSRSRKSTKTYMILPQGFYDSIAFNLNDQLLNDEDWTSCRNNLVQEDSVQLKDGKRLRWYFAIPPGTTESLPAGNYSLKITSDSLSSASIKFYLSEKDSAFSVEDQIEVAYFELDCGQPSKAKEIAEELISAYPNSIEATVLMADVALEEERMEQSLALYTKALQMSYLQYPDSPEPPDYIISQISYIKAYLESIKKGGR